MVRKFAWLAAASGIALSGTAAFGQITNVAQPTGGTPQSAQMPTQAAPSDANEIVVTGSRLRAESVQQTPIAVSVVSPKQVEALHATDIQALSAVVPNLSVSASSQSPGAPLIYLRGFGVSTTDPAPEPGVAVYIDGVYQSIVAGGLADLFDLKQVEVLRGPQGTLLGKNAAAGAILLTRSRPTGELDGKISAEYGTFNLYQLQGLLDVPIVDGILAGKLYATYRHRDDYIKNLDDRSGDNGGQNRGSVRGALLFTPTENLTAYLSADYLWDRSSQVSGRNLSGPGTIECASLGICAPEAGLYHVSNIQLTTRPKSNDNNITSNIDWSISDAAKLTSITGYRKYTLRDFSDLDYTPLSLLEVQRFNINLKQFSQEMRLSSIDHGLLDMNGRLHWLIAGYYNHSNARVDQVISAFGTPRAQGEAVLRDSYAVFGHVDFDLLKGLTISTGARQSWDRFDHRFSLAQVGTAPQMILPNRQVANFRNFSVEAGAQYKFSQTKMVYFRYAEGYRGGGFIGLPASLAAALPYQPETSRSYEAGIKTEWFDRRLLFNATVFNVDYRNLQRSATLPGPSGFIQTTGNVAGARTRGVEIETIFRPGHNFSINGSLGYLDAHYKDYLVIDPVTGDLVDHSDDSFVFSPKWTASIRPAYTIDLAQRLAGFDQVTLQAKADWRSAYYVSTSLDPVSYQRGYATVDAQVTLAGDKNRYSVTAYVKNLFGKKWITYGGNISGIVQYVNDNEGRTAGISAEWHF